MNRPLPHSPALVELLLRFVFSIVLPAAPPALWWAMGLGLFSVLNLVFQREIWPHTPHAIGWFLLLGICSALLLPWQVARTASHVAELLHSSVWRTLWRLASWGAYIAGGLALLPGAIVIGYLLIDVLVR